MPSITNSGTLDLAGNTIQGTIPSELWNVRSLGEWVYACVSTTIVVRLMTRDLLISRPSLVVCLLPKTQWNSICSETVCQSMRFRKPLAISRIWVSAGLVMCVCTHRIFSHSVVSFCVSITNFSGDCSELQRHSRFYSECIGEISVTP